jgi:hydroxyethylthiazole kinase-like sugar kinase family protein
VFVVGTKKDKLVAYRKMELLEAHMQKTNDYKQASKLANEEANQLADDQFMKLKDQLSQIEHYKADGYCCISKGEH